MNRIGYCNRIFCLSQLCECKQIMGCTVLTESVEHQGPAICQGSDLVALITSRPHKTMELVFIFQIFLTRNGMRRDMESSEAMLTDYWKNPGDVSIHLLFYREKVAGNLSHSHPPWQESSNDILSLTAFPCGLPALFPKCPRTLLFLPRLECPTTDILPLPVTPRSRTQLLKSYLCIVRS